MPQPSDLDAGRFSHGSFSLLFLIPGLLQRHSHSAGSVRSTVSTVLAVTGGQ